MAKKVDDQEQKSTALPDVYYVMKNAGRNIGHYCEEGGLDYGLGGDVLGDGELRWPGKYYCRSCVDSLGKPVPIPSSRAPVCPRCRRKGKWEGTAKCPRCKTRLPVRLEDATPLMEE